MRCVCIHGLGQTPSSWDVVKARMPERIEMDCPDLAALASRGGAVYSELYGAFESYCDSIDQPLNLCGLSLGAVLALNYALERGEKTQSLTLIAPQYDMPRGLLKFQELVFRLLPQKAFADTGFSKADFMRLTGSMTDLKFGKRAAGITCRTLIVCGLKDRANLKAAKALADIIENSELKLIENAGHEVNLDAPAELAGALAEFYTPFD